MASRSSGVASLLDAVPASGSRSGDGDRRHKPLLGFKSIPPSPDDTVVVPPGYTARVLISWGDPVSDGPAFKPDASNSAADQAQQWGMHNDGVVYFPLRGSRDGLLVQNNEYTDDVLLFPDGTANWNAGEDGEVAERPRRQRHRDPRGRGGGGDEWEVVRPSRYARRITGQTPMKIGGPLGASPTRG